MASRRAGLSYKIRPEPLLSIVANKPRRQDLEKDVPVDADPISSGGESDDDVVPAKNLQLQRSGLDDLSDDESSGDSSRGRRVSMKRTTFKSADSSSSRNALSGSANRAASSSTGGKGQGSAAGPSSSSGKRRRVASQPESVPSSAEHLKNEQGFTKRQAVKATYGKASGSSQETGAKKAVKKDPPAKRVKLRAPDLLDSPKKSRSAKMKRPDDPILSPPSKAPGARTMKGLPSDSEDSDPETTAAINSRYERLKRDAKPQSRSKKKALGGIWAKPSSPPPVKFQIPADIPDFSQDSRTSRNSADADSPLSDLEPSQVPAAAASEGSDLDEEKEETPKQANTVCPWCGDAVSEGLLKEFSKGKRLSVRMQTKFCHKHKKQTAMDEWRERRYPVVEWAGLESRFEEHREVLLQIVNGQPSHFRTIHKDKVDTGQARSMMKEEDNLNPGYYGPRGFNVMCDYLVREFGDLLKERAVSDRVIAGRGSAAFIQAVLVAELAARLIQEDMDVSVPVARDILEESKALGEMVHEDV